MSRETTGGGLYRNVVSYVGALMMLVSILLILFFILLQVSIDDPSPYIGIIAFLVTPVFFVAGLLLFLGGMRRESLRRRRAHTTEALPFPRVDLNDPRHRKIFAWTLVGGSVAGVVMLYAGYNAYLYTESVEFCGTVCHTVMEPEHTAYLNGPHARVRCVECHVGHGVDWYVKSKLSGVRQVFAVTFDTYEKPIPVPVENLRPARETCEQCHWPDKFFGAQLMQVPHFRYNEENTAEQINLLVKTGGGASGEGPKAGIHWHMVLGNDVYFKATDRHEQNIPWFRVERSDGTEAVYVDPDAGVTEAELAALPEEKMDCMHCHNRPSHIFPPPESAVDLALASEDVARDLPWIKREMVDALTGDYQSRDEAHQGIREAIVRFYRQEGLYEKRAQDVDAAVAAAVQIFDRSNFPLMNVDWETYANNLGHRNWPGCERCHDGEHRRADGVVLTRGCTVCHTMPVRSPLSPLGAEIPESDLPWHPWPLEGKHAELLCSACHRAGFRPQTECGGCHGLDLTAPMMGSGCETCHVEDQQILPVIACSDCHTVGGLHTEVEPHAETDCTQCHRPHVWTVKGRETCLECHEDLADHNAPEACGDCHEFTGE